MSERYKDSDKMIELINDDYTLLQVISRFNIKLGFGEKTIKEVCSEQSVNSQTFLAVVNTYKYGAKEAENYIERVNIKSLVNYLRQSHDYYLNFLLPSIRRKLIEALDCSAKNEIAFLILKFYDEYSAEVKKHMINENETIFAYADGLTNKENKIEKHQEYEILHTFPIEQKMNELKNIIIKYCNMTLNSNLINTVLYDIYMCEDDLLKHCALEDSLFFNALKLLENKKYEEKDYDEENQETDYDNDILSEREKDIIEEIVKGMSNKEIANNLCISINTVTTHRRNIARKLDIHSPAGLTIYAIANNIVDIKDIKLS